MAIDLERLKSLAGLLASVFSLKNGQRNALCDGVVQRDYDCIKAAHKEFHSALFRVAQSLRCIERRMAAGEAISGELTSLLECLNDCAASRIDNQADRIELYQHCLTLAKIKTYPFSSIVSPVDDDEWKIIRLFSANVCRYFGDLNTYSHDFGNVLNWLGGRCQMWDLLKSPSIVDVRKTIQDVEESIARLTKRWTEISRYFRDIENVLKFNFDIDMTKQIDIDRQIEAVEKEILNTAAA